MLNSEKSALTESQESVAQISRRVLEAIQTTFLKNFETRDRRKMTGTKDTFPLTLQEMSLVLDSLIRKELETSRRGRASEAPTPTDIPLRSMVNVEQKRYKDSPIDSANKKMSTKKTTVHECKGPFSDLLRLREQKETLLCHRQRDINDQLFAIRNRKNASVNTDLYEIDPCTYENLSHVSSKQQAYKNRCIAVDKVDQGTNTEQPIRPEQAIIPDRESPFASRDSPQSITKSKTNGQLANPREKLRSVNSPYPDSSPSQSPANFSPGSMQSRSIKLQNSYSINRDGKGEEPSGIRSFFGDEPISETSNFPRDCTFARRTSKSHKTSERFPFSSPNHATTRGASKTISSGVNPRLSQNDSSGFMPTNNWELDLSNFNV
uniref:AlNc14C225G9195 protein n=1 Tax=Albugo laibachii Nc14 TaxID=890382 RepID=F0WS56_9STRA|nr:AlNc14C225G9195 [Albugo laibachii Nc14]|eukprot:CCA24174.1 AlNc14C225G9195 [Albugo laibachii Nc14]